MKKLWFVFLFLLLLAGCGDNSAQGVVAEGMSNQAIEVTTGFFDCEKDVIIKNGETELTYSFYIVDIVSNSHVSEINMAIEGKYEILYFAIDGDKTFQFKRSLTIGEVKSTAELSAPSTISIENNILSFTNAEGANGYQLFIYRDGLLYRDPISTYNGHDLSSLLLPQAAYELKVRSVNSSGSLRPSEESVAIDFEAPDPSSLGQAIDHAPVFSGVATMSLMLKESGTFDVLTGVQVTDDIDTNILSLVTYTITDLSTKSNVTSIPSNKSGAYLINYSVTDSGENTVTASRRINIGNVDTSLEDFTAYHGVGYVYDYDSLEYEVVFQDDFNGTTVNTANWGNRIGNGDWGWGNGELQNYTNRSQNIQVSDGTLKLIALKENYGAQEYTSGCILSKDKKSFLYGKIEVRAKLPVGLGTWAAFWMLPADTSAAGYGAWPTSGEIDIMENVGYDLNRVFGSAHTGLYNGLATSSGSKTSSAHSPNSTTEFHVYGVEWLPDMLIFTVDGEEYFRYVPTDYVTESGLGAWPFDKPFYIVLNLAVGGTWGGKMGVEPGDFPATFEIDYVKVSQSSTITNIKQIGA